MPGDGIESSRETQIVKTERVVTTSCKRPPTTSGVFTAALPRLCGGVGVDAYDVYNWQRLASSRGSSQLRESRVTEMATNRKKKDRLSA